MMEKREIKNLGASIRARLTNIGKETKRDFDAIPTKEFKSSREKQAQWTAFLKRSRLESYKTFNEAINYLELFLEPACSQKSFSSGDQFRWDPEKLT